MRRACKEWSASMRSYPEGQHPTLNPKACLGDIRLVTLERIHHRLVSVTPWEPVIITVLLED